MKQSLSLVTLGVADYGRAKAFYEALGWTTALDIQETAFFPTNGVVVVLWGRDKLAAELGLPDDAARFGGIALAHNVSSREEVHAVIEQARGNGAEIARESAETFYGGYAGVFCDLDGHAWEVAHNPGFGLEESGSVVLPGATDEFRPLPGSRQLTTAKGAKMTTITPFLWFDTAAEDAAKFYVCVFPNSKIVTTTHYGAEGPAPEGMVMTVAFELDGNPFVGLNGGPNFSFTEAISFVISCEDQAEIDSYWEKLSADGGEEGPCGWLKDRFGLSWQVVPTALPRLLTQPDPEKAKRVFAAMMEMKKLDIAGLEAAAA